MPSAHLDKHGEIAVIRFDNPPMNTLAHAMRTSILGHLRAAIADPAVRAIVLTGGGRAFCAGAEIREFNTPKTTEFPMNKDVIAAMEASPKPVIAAIHGVAMGGGLENALGCHWRIATPSAQLALPEVKLGLLPGAGGTQRLPRAVGGEKALEMIVGGDPVRAAALKGTVLVDEVAEVKTGEELLPLALDFARRIVAEGRPLRRTRDLPVTVENGAALFAAARERVAKECRGQPAPMKCVEAVEAAANLPFDEGLKVERACFDFLVNTPESKALRHAFFGERTVAKIPDVPEDTRAPEIRGVAILGAGTMGGGIAMACANAKLPVRLLEASPEALERGLGMIRRNYEASVARGRMKPEEMEARLVRITPVSAMADIADADLVIEAVFEDMKVKQEVFAKLDAVMKPGAILATNTSTLDVNAIARATKRPQDVVGLHFFSPANVMRLLEIVRGEATSKPVLAASMNLAKTLGKVGVVAGVCDGFIGNRLLERYFQQAYFLLDEGATPWEVDRAMQDWGMAMGPFAVSDLAGNDIHWHIRKRRGAEMPDFVYGSFPDRVCELGRFGQKTGAGYYRYEKGSRTPQPDAQIEQLLAGHRQSLGIEPRAIPAQEIVERCLLALANEGARVLEEGIAQRAVDIDMVYLAGYGFPRWKGGPMFVADAMGLCAVVEKIRGFAAGRHGSVWTPAPLMLKLAAENDRFNEWKRH